MESKKLKCNYKNTKLLLKARGFYKERKDNSNENIAKESNISVRQVLTSYNFNWNEKRFLR